MKIYEGDCREVLKRVEDNSQHLIVTSPPYNLDIDYGNNRYNMTRDEYAGFTEAWLKECYRVLVDGGRICVNIPMYHYKHKYNMYSFYLEIMNRLGFVDRDTFIWVKLDGLRFAHSPKVYGKVGPKNPKSKYVYEVVLIMQKGKDWLEGGDADITFNQFFEWAHTVWFIKPEYQRVEHPVPFPDELAYRLIKFFSFKGQNVLDPFLGSGTTLKACKKLDRNGIGIELNPDYIALAKRKCDAVETKKAA